MGGDGDNTASAAAAAATAASTRIFVGGVGESVTEDDVRNTFSKMGKIDSIKIVRTKGRSFAYFDFIPSNEKALSKLFSSYNGCMWKGGRLRLEKAKEHYLLRLRREWAEDAEPPSEASNHNFDDSENMLFSEKPRKTSSSESMQLKIFFPKSKKIKSIPFKGTGKHKYSFQRVEIPSLPIHFCDCEEHSLASDAPKGKPASDIEPENGGINEDELNMMKSVMNKLFGTECSSNGACDEYGFTVTGDNIDNSINEMPVDGNETDPAADEDNLVINIVAGGHDTETLTDTLGPLTNLGNKGSMGVKSQTSRDRPAQKTDRNEKRKVVPSNRKRKAPFTEESDDFEIVSTILEKKGSPEAREAPIKKRQSSTQQLVGNVSWSQRSSWRDLVGEAAKNPFHISHVTPMIASGKEAQVSSDILDTDRFSDRENQKLEEQGNIESQPDQSGELGLPSGVQPAKIDAVNNKEARGAAWRKKSSWTQLVGDANKNSFSISQILPDVSFEKEDVLQPKGMHAANSADVNKHSSDKNDSVKDSSQVLAEPDEGCNGVPSGSNRDILARKENSPVIGVEQLKPEIKRGEALTSSVEEKTVSTRKQTAVKDITIGETCTFMKSAASMKDWMKTKTALSGSLKKKVADK